MKKMIIVISSAILISCQISDSMKLTGDYLGQSLPGSTPEIFAPGVISTRYHEHSAPNISPDGKVMLYTLSCEHGHTIMMLTRQGKSWSMPKACSFSGIYSDDGHEWSLHGSTLFFRSKRPLPGQPETAGEYRDWKVFWTGTEWGEPVPSDLPTGVRTQSGSIYCYRQAPGRDDFDLFVADEKRNDLRPLSDRINSLSNDGTVYLPPDESYILFSSAGHDPIGIMDLFVSFRQTDGSWGESINLGELVNKPEMITRFPRVSRDGRFLFFWQNRNNEDGTDPLSPVEESVQYLEPWRPDNGRDGDIYWVDFSVVGDLKARQ